jgi:group I intron endonuclease
LIIYKATNLINNKIYIGQTTQTLERRKRQHEESIHYKAKCRVFARAILKYGKENFKWEIIDYAKSIEELNQKESYWIKKLDSIVDDGKGYNLNTGGSNPNHSEATKLLMSKAQLGSKNHMYGIVGKDNPTSKPVINITDNIKYENATQCAEKEEIELSKVCAVCRGERATTNYKIYRYLDENGKIINVDSLTNQQSTPVVNITNGMVFDTCNDAEEWMNHSGRNLSHLLSINNGACWFSGYAWKYRDLNINYIPSKPLNKKPNAKKVINVDSGEIFDSIKSAAESINKNYRNLATALRNKNNDCIWNKIHWKVIN